LEAGKAQATADAITKDGGQAIAVPGDMLDSEYLKVLVKKAAEFGNGKIHIIVNNAGLVPSSADPRISADNCRYTWDGVIHKVELLQYHMGIRYMADWNLLDVDLHIAEEYADTGATLDDRQTMGQHHSPA
jgi:NAD(P)-dependent dehydrogenase (short-subunit alcohol dehydrogenase family)